MTLITHSDETTAASRPSHPNRRGVRWDLFECDGRGTLEIQRVDLVDLDGVKPFATDRETAGFVLCMAQWTDNPDRALRDECRAALAQLVESWPANGKNGSQRQ